MKNLLIILLSMLIAHDCLSQQPALHIRQDGNVGINTFDPGFPFTVSVNSDAAGVNAIILENVGTNGDGAKFFQKIESGGYGQLFVRDNVNSDRLFLNSGANSFIMSAMSIGGTNSFGNLFHVAGDASKPGGGDWLSASDKRLKKNIQDYSDGLLEVLKIRPVTFEYNGKGGIKSGKTHVGVVAQEIQKIAPYMISEFSPTEIVITDDLVKGPSAKTVKSSERYLQYEGNALQYMLVNAIKELHDNLNEKEQLIDDLYNNIESLEQSINSLTNQLRYIKLEGPSDGSLLRQNIPNPFSEETEISYSIPEGSQLAEIQFFDLNGKLLKVSTIEHAGTGILKVDGSELSSGFYSYQLVVDGRLVDTKKMTKVR